MTTTASGETTTSPVKKDRQFSLQLEKDLYRVEVSLHEEELVILAEQTTNKEKYRLAMDRDMVLAYTSSCNFRLNSTDFYELIVAALNGETAGLSYQCSFDLTSNQFNIGIVYTNQIGFCLVRNFNLELTLVEQSEVDRMASMMSDFKSMYGQIKSIDLVDIEERLDDLENNSLSAENFSAFVVGRFKEALVEIEALKAQNAEIKKLLDTHTWQLTSHVQLLDTHKKVIDALPRAPASPSITIPK